MKILIHTIVLSFGTLLILLSCSSFQKDDANDNKEQKDITSSFTLSDFYSENPALSKKTDSILNQLSDRQLAGQMIVQAAGRLGKPDSIIEQLIKNNIIGGVLLLNGSMEGFKQKVEHFNDLARKSGALPLIYSSDAEPSLINRKIKGSHEVPHTIDLNTVEKNKEVAGLIVQDLENIGITHDYAPVLDISPDNEAIRNRSYGYNADSVVILAQAFVETLESNGIAATIKHFPGHGLVKGDSHTNLVYIDGEMKEVDLYKPFIENGITSVMVGHIAVRNNPKYNTNGLPASCSSVIVNGLLKEELGFKGIVITDAMNMGALAKLDDAGFQAVQAGNDMILMPVHEEQLIDEMVNEMMANEDFKNRIKHSARKIIRLKICQRLI